MQNLNIKPLSKEEKACLYQNDEGKYDILLVPFVDLIARIFKVVSFGNQIYICKDGVFGPDNGEINAAIINLLNRLSQKCSQKRATSYVNEIRTRLLATNLFAEYPFNKRTNLIPVLNGVLAIDYASGKIRLVKHDHKNLFTYLIPVNFNSNADPTDILRILHDWMGDLAWILIQVAAQCLLQSQGKIYKKAYLILGKKDAGKSTYLDLLGKFFGDSLIARVDFQKLTGNNFALAQLEGKLINLADDQAAFQLKETGTFKRLTGTCMHDVEEKYKKGCTKFVNPVYIFAANTPPTLPKEDDVSPFLERFEIITFDRKFKVNPDFAKFLTNPENLSAFLNLVLQEMIRIDQKGIRTIEREESNYELWALKGNSLYRDFIKEYFVKDSDAYVEKDVWYNTYIEYCKEVDLRPYDRAVLFRKLSEIGIEDTRITREGERVRLIKGWDLKSRLARMPNQVGDNK